MRELWLRTTGILVMAGFFAGGLAAPLQAQGYVGLTAGLYQSEEDDADRTELFGVRAGYRFQSNLGIEGSLTRVDLLDTVPPDDDPGIPELDLDLTVDLYNLDLSLLWYPGGGNLSIFAGPGVAQIDAELQASFFGQTIRESETSEILTAHAGVAYEWSVGDRFFLRPEARVRRYFDDEIEEVDEEDSFAIAYESTDYEAGLTFGWRF